VSRRIAVILGGRSSENEISIASAKSVAAALEAGGDEVVTVEIDRTGRWQLPAARAALDPGSGEDAPTTSLERLPPRDVAAKLEPR